LNEYALEWSAISKYDPIKEMGYDKVLTLSRQAANGREALSSYDPEEWNPIVGKCTIAQAEAERRNELFFDRMSI
jgi:hypothetical protein